VTTLSDIVREGCWLFIFIPICLFLESSNAETGHKRSGSAADNGARSGSPPEAQGRAARFGISADHQLWAAG